MIAPTTTITGVSMIEKIAPTFCSFNGLLDQRLFRHCATGELRDGAHIFAPKFPSFAEIGRGLEVGDAKKLSIFPDCRGSIIRADTAWIGPGMNRNQIRGDRSGNMHRAAIDADDECSRAYEPDQLQ